MITGTSAQRSLDDATPQDAWGQRPAPSWRAAESWTRWHAAAANHTPHHCSLSRAAAYHMASSCMIPSSSRRSSFGPALLLEQRGGPLWPLQWQRSGEAAAFANGPLGLRGPWPPVLLHRSAAAPGFWWRSCCTAAACLRSYSGRAANLQSYLAQLAAQWLRAGRRASAWFEFDYNLVARGKLGGDVELRRQRVVWHKAEGNAVEA